MSPPADSLLLDTAKRIQVVLPDDGTDRTLIKSLRTNFGITRADSVAVRAVAALQAAKTRNSRLPEPLLAKLVTIIVSLDEADAVFHFVYTTAQIGRPGGGMMLMDKLLGATLYKLPEDVPDEAE